MADESGEAFTAPTKAKDRHRSNRETVEARRRVVMRALIRGHTTAQILRTLQTRFADVTYRAVERDVAECSKRLRKASVEIDVVQEIANALATNDELVREMWNLFREEPDPVRRASILTHISKLAKARMDLIARTGATLSATRRAGRPEKTWDERVLELRRARGLEPSAQEPYRESDA